MVEWLGDRLGLEDGRKGYVETMDMSPIGYKGYHS